MKSIPIFIFSCCFLDPNYFYERLVHPLDLFFFDFCATGQETSFFPVQNTGWFGTLFDFKFQKQKLFRRIWMIFSTLIIFFLRKKVQETDCIWSSFGRCSLFAKQFTTKWWWQNFSKKQKRTVAFLELFASHFSWPFQTTVPRVLQ